MSNVSERDSIEALRNDYYEVLTAFNPEIITITKLRPEDSSDMCLLKVHVDAPCYVLKGKNSNSPQMVGSNDFFVRVKNGYPSTKPVVYFNDNAINASVNTFKSDGNQCIDTWNPATSSLKRAIEKTIRDIIHDPTVTKYHSMANSSLKEWQQDLTSRGLLPTIDPAILLKKEVEKAAPSLPTKRTNSVSNGTNASAYVRALPGKK